MTGTFQGLPDDLPEPLDDGACDHLLGQPMPALSLDAHDGTVHDLTALGSGRTAVFVYPRTGVPGIPMPEGWDLIPGARGCTPQSCAYRDEIGEFTALGVEVVGLSSQDSAAQREFAEREHIPFRLLSDPSLELSRSMGLPTFTADGDELFKRVTLVIEDGAIVYVRYPVFPTDGDAAATLSWLRANPSAT